MKRRSVGTAVVATVAGMVALSALFEGVTGISGAEHIRSVALGLVAFGLLLQVLLAAWVGQDAETRGMGGTLWGLLVFFTSLVGALAYLIAREGEAGARGATACPGCGSPVARGSRFCSGCGSSLALQCPTCRTPTLPQWRFCPHCATALAGEGP